MKTLFIVLAGIGLLACHTGDFQESCNKDGSCNSENLVCSRFNGNCYLREATKVAGECSYESECFCRECARHCADAGVRLCAYTDTSVWGSKPAVCECK